MAPAFTWNGDIEQSIAINGKETKETFKHRDQVAAEIIYFCDCIRKKKEPEPSGREGLLDVRIIDALRKSYLKNKTIRLALIDNKKRPQHGQSIERRPARKPKPLRAPPPCK